MNSPAEIAKNYINIGIGKVTLPKFKMLILAVLAGVFIALAGVGATAAAVTVESASIGKLIGAVIFPAGLAMVLIAGSELFTGNSLLVIPLLDRKISFGGMIKNWVIVYIGNFIGAVLIAALVVYGHTFSLFGDGLAQSAVSIAESKVAISFTDGLIRGVLCNVLVCIAVWMSFAAKSVSGKIIGLFFPIMLFVLCGYEHCVANMYYIPAGIFAAAEYSIAADGLNWGTFLLNNLLPVTIGNILGGGLVGAAYWGIFLKGRKES